MITIAGLVWAFIMIFTFFKKKLKQMLFFTLLFMTFQACNVIVIGGKGIGPGILTAIVFIIFTVIRGKFRIRKIRKQKAIYFFAVVLGLVPVISSIVNGVLGINWIFILQLLVYIACMFSIQATVMEITSDDIYDIIRKILIFHCCFAVIQILTTMGVLPLRPVLDLLVFNDDNPNIVYHWQGYNRMLSTLMEPSYFASLMVGGFYFLFSQKHKWNENKILLVVILIEIILTKSSTAYGAFAITGLLFVMFSKELSIRQKIVIVGMGIAAMSIMYFGFYSVLDAVIFSKGDSASFRQRRRFNNRAIEAFTTSVWWGIGYKEVRGSSIVASILGESGIMGLVSYILFNTSIIKSKRYDINNKIDFYVAVKFAVIAAMLTQIIACPDLDLCTYWFWIFVLSAAIKVTNNRIIEKELTE